MPLNAVQEPGDWRRFDTPAQVAQIDS